MSDQIAVTGRRRGSQELPAITTDLERLTADWEKLGAPNVGGSRAPPRDAKIYAASPPLS